MGYLLPIDYTEMIYNSINLESNLIADYFISEYEKNKDKNIDFVNQLSNSIYLFESVINRHKEFIKTTDISSDEFNYFNHVFSDYSFTDKEKTLKYCKKIERTLLHENHLKEILSSNQEGIKFVLLKTIFLARMAVKRKRQRRGKGSN
jgi:hypothetical protein